MRNNRKQFLLIIIGTLLMGVSYKSIYDSAGMVTGGFTGIAIIVKHITTVFINGGIPLWCTSLALNVPVFIVAYKVKGMEFVKRTVFATLCLTIFLAILPEYATANMDLLLVAIFGGAINGLGIALVLMSYATTGGSDMIAALIQHYRKQYSVVRIMQILDGLIVLIGVFVFGLRISLYAVIAIYVTTLVSDRVIDGLNFAKSIFIISDKYDVIGKRILERIERGVTVLDGKGLYSGNKKNVIFCIASKKQSITIKEIALAEDDKAFLIIGDVREVLGEGFGKSL